MQSPRRSFPQLRAADPHGGPHGGPQVQCRVQREILLQHIQESPDLSLPGFRSSGRGDHRGGGGDPDVAPAAQAQRVEGGGHHRSFLRDNPGKVLHLHSNRATRAGDPCSSTEQDYQPLMELTNQTVPCNKTLLWSKTRDLVHDYAWVQPDLFTLEDTLLGYMADGLTWCGDPGSNEMNYQSCPDWRKDCSNNSVSIFWNTVSKRFAGDACGVVHVLLNGSIRNTFDEKSTFGRVEVFNLHPEKVHMLQAWVVQDIRTISSNSCSNSSIKDLEAILSKRNITFTCQDNYRPIRLLQCVKDPEHSSCRSEI
ncbi:ADP-ribosyl cyclase/cyclic ADP-ribose hydrolase 1 isoform X1 [Suricata suricatta]|uniref:ADP-ribosyl cyclase/cyclic ADP-ribose hydrolase 1 isoform X1 n=1 Tax=Suricata suricatta TaxID=37032 RepID=UPI001155C7A0|nr:ADP-ribosyl cyclase/cyclic ADP-ribose hydrolase 1 isoform X1 [Suricata suricatta]